MKNNLTIKEALKMAETTGQQVTLTLRSGKEFRGCIVEKLWSTSCRIWVNPTNNGRPGIIGTTGVGLETETVTVKERETLTETQTLGRPGHRPERIEKAIVANHAVESVAFDHEIQTGCESSNDSHNNLEGIREALCIALLTHQTVEVGLIRNEHPEELRGKIIDVDSDTFCIRLSRHDKMKVEEIDRVEYVLFS